MELYNSIHELIPFVFEKPFSFTAQLCVVPPANKQIPTCFHLALHTLPLQHFLSPRRGKSSFWTTTSLIQWNYFLYSMLSRNQTWVIYKHQWPKSPNQILTFLPSDLLWNVISGYTDKNCVSDPQKLFPLNMEMPPCNFWVTEPKSITWFKYMMWKNKFNTSDK